MGGTLNSEVFVGLFVGVVKLGRVGVFRSGLAAEWKAGLQGDWAPLNLVPCLWVLNDFWKKFGVGGGGGVVGGSPAWLKLEAADLSACVNIMYLGRAAAYSMYTPLFLPLSLPLPLAKG